jgi:hypothetical protein
MKMAQKVKAVMDGEPRNRRATLLRRTLEFAATLIEEESEDGNGNGRLKAIGDEYFIREDPEAGFCTTGVCVKAGLSRSTLYRDNGLRSNSIIVSGRRYYRYRDLLEALESRGLPPPELENDQK